LRIRSAARIACSRSIEVAAFLDQRDDVAHAEDAAGDAAGIEVLQRVHALAGRRSA
jgi:hypothetical protein